jgi:phytoene dehydrogenase-like protein
MSIIVIGAGHNGLTAAATLAKAGEQVTVLEAREQVGGLAAAEEFADGYTVPGVLHDTRGVREAIVDSLGLGRHGLKRSGKPLEICAPRSEGDPIWLRGDAVEGVDDEDVAALAKWRAFISRVAPVVRAVLDQEPPEPMSDMWAMFKTGLNVRRLGADDMLELLRVAPSCVADWMRDSFTDERLRAALSLPAIEGAYCGPWSAGTAANLLLAEATAEAEIEGGAAALTDALQRAAEGFGATIRTAARVKRIELSGRAVSGVELEDGEVIEAKLVLATCDPKQTFLKLLGSHRIAVSLANRIRVFRTRGTTAKVHLALSGALEIADGTAVEALRTGETLDDIERAFDPAKYRRFAEKPALNVRVPSMRDDGLVAEEGHHVVSIIAHHAPYDLEAGWNDDTREALGDAVVDELARHCPKLKERIVAREVLTPVDLEERYGLTGGHIHHGEHAFDQLLFMRPSVDCAKYATPVPGLFLGGSGNHPGGGITCAPGALAARAILARR